MNNKDLEEIRGQIETLKKEAIKKYTVVFQQGRKNLFDQFPELTAFSWEQIFGEHSQTFHSWHDYPDLFFGLYDKDWVWEEQKDVLPPNNHVHKVYRACKEFLSVFEDNDIKGMFALKDKDGRIKDEKIIILREQVIKEEIINE